MIKVYGEGEVTAESIPNLPDGTEVDGHVYQLCAGMHVQQLWFQRGPTKEAGRNGITTECVISALVHRLGVLNSRYPCAENERAIHYLELAKQALEERQRDRQARGVEGLNKP